MKFYMGRTKTGHLRHLVVQSERDAPLKAVCGINVTRLVTDMSGNVVPFADHWVTESDPQWCFRCKPLALNPLLIEGFYPEETTDGP